MLVCKAIETVTLIMTKNSIALFKTVVYEISTRSEVIFLLIF